MYFFECLYFSEHDIRISLYTFWLRKGHVCYWWGDGGHPKCVQLRTGEGGVMHHVYVRTYTIGFNDFGSIFVL